MLASLTVLHDPDRNRVRLDLTRSDTSVVTSFYLDREEARRLAQQLIRGAAALTDEGDPR